MLGAITGDIIGSVYEHNPIKSTNFQLFGPRSLFTDDSVCSVAIAEALLGDGDFAAALRRYVRKYPRRGYGGMFLQWALSDDLPAYGSWGNGSAMRVGAVAYLARDERQVLDLAARQSAVTHSHADAVAGAQATALAMWLGRQGADKSVIRRTIGDRFEYDLSPRVEDIRDDYTFDVSARGTVPPAIICALEAETYEDAVRLAVSLGGDADTLACIAGGIAETIYGLPLEIEFEARQRLDESIRGFPEETNARAPGYFAGTLLDVVDRVRGVG
jgi:ADP-ribosylglycohydrolase